MQYVYVLFSLKAKWLYIGCTNNLKHRFEEHNLGKVSSTREHRPFKLLFYEAFISKTDAFNREKWLKTGWGRNHIQKALKESIKVFGR